MAENNKDTIYIDVDDEITVIVEKLQNSDSKIVALVLPKRAVALQSIVNMKLLKRAADEAGKNPVLITSEAGLLPLAGATGMYVAKNLQSKPEVPPSPDDPSSDEEEVAQVESEGTDSAGSKAGAAAVGAAAVDETIDMEQEDPVAASAADSLKKTKKSKGKKSDKPKIPNFEKFRKKLFLVIGGVILLIVLWYLAVFVAPTAKVTIETNTESVDSSFQFTASPNATQVDVGKNVVPAKVAEIKKEDVGTAPATGQKDMGAKAGGTVTMSIACADVSGTPPTVPAGTGVSSSGLTFITKSAVSITTPDFSNGCRFVGATSVVAQNNGDQYNLGAGGYTVAGFSNVSASGTAMTGGSSKTAKVVSAQDIETAKKKFTIKDDTVKAELKKQLEKDGYFAISGSFKKTNESTVPVPGQDQEGSEVKVTYSATYSMAGVKKTDLAKLIENSVKDEIDTKRQKVQDDGTGSATFTSGEVSANGDRAITINTKVVIGPDIDVDSLKSSLAGKKGGETENIVKELPSVKDARVSYSPFWVSRTPKKVSKITIEFKSVK